jgi:hypothetical protein
MNIQKNIKIMYYEQHSGRNILMSLLKSNFC